MVVSVLVLVSTLPVHALIQLCAFVFSIHYPTGYIFAACLCTCMAWAVHEMSTSKGDVSNIHVLTPIRLVPSVATLYVLKLSFYARRAPHLRGILEQ